MKTTLLNLTLLYVEDDTDTRKQLSNVLRYKVDKLYVAKDGKEALELFKSHQIHAVLSDFQMPHMDGNELCQAIKGIKPFIPFILLTAYNDSKLLIDAINAGVDKFLTKPIDGDKLFALLDHIGHEVMQKFQLERTNTCLQEAEKVAHLAYWDVNLLTRKISFSEEAAELFEIEQHIGYETFAKMVYDEDRPLFLDIFEKRIFEEDEIDELLAIKTAKSEILYMRIAAKRWESSVCGRSHAIGLFQDVSRYELERLRLLRESQSDPILKIANKNVLTLELTNLIKRSKRYGDPLTVLFFDIDNFKGINDNYGHLTGDSVLQQLTSIVKEHIRESDHFGRWGGDEFVIVPNNTNLKSANKLGQKLVDVVAAFAWPDDMSVTISVGVASYEAGDNVSSLLCKADKMMLKAKKCGKNRTLSTMGKGDEDE
ncbi:MAG: diguanylate cyclase [Campylobacterota bacterium]|nr:diguanylate cyclase [Campylobacterota bacterium]